MVEIPDEEYLKLQARLEELEVIAMKSRQVEEEINRRNRELSTLYKIERAAAQSLNMEVMLKKVLETTLEALEIEAGGIYLREPNGDMRLQVYHGFSGNFFCNSSEQTQCPWQVQCHRQ
ncbi:MAG: hypothetical protein WC556_04210 [Candidatus Methanoperedens sp.]